MGALREQTYSDFGLSSDDGALLDSLTSAYLAGRLRRSKGETQSAALEEHSADTVNPENTASNENPPTPIDDENGQPTTENDFSWLIDPNEDAEFVALLEGLITPTQENAVVPHGTSLEDDSINNDLTEDGQEDDEIAVPLHQTTDVRMIGPSRFTNTLARKGRVDCGGALAVSPHTLSGVGLGSISEVKKNLERCGEVLRAFEELPDWLIEKASVHESYGDYVWDALGYLHRYHAKGGRPTKEPSPKRERKTIEDSPFLQAPDIPVSTFGFTPKVRAALRALGIERMGQLVGVSDELLGSQRGVGVGAIAKIDKALHSIGLSRTPNGDQLIGTNSPDGPSEVSESSVQTSNDVPRPRADSGEGTPIDTIGFTPRIVHALKQLGVDRLEQIVGISDEQLLSNRGIGVKALEDIDDALHDAGLSRDTAARDERSAPSTQMPELTDAMKRDVERALSYFTMAHPDLVIDKELFVAWSTYFASQFVASPDSDFYRFLIDSTRETVYEPQTVGTGSPDIESWLDSGTMPKRSSEILRMRFLGATLQECASQYGLTRERVRQIAERALLLKPRLVEDDYLYLASEYALSRDDLGDIFALSEVSSGYILLSSHPSTTHKPLSEAIVDAGVPEYQRAAISEYVATDSGLLANTPKRQIKMALLEDYLRENASNDYMDCRHLYSAYSTFVEERFPNESNYLVPGSDRSLSGILHRSDFAVFSNGDRVRYKEISREFLSTLIDELDLSQYAGSEISTLLCFSQHSTALMRLDVRNEYELHYLLRRAQELNVEPSLTKGLNFGRSPMIEISCKGVREKQVIDLLSELSPVPIEFFAEEYERRYGVNRSTFLGSWKKDYLSYVVGDYFVFHEEALTEDDVRFISSTMENGITTITRLQESGEEGSAVSRKCGLVSLSNAGFAMSGRCIFDIGMDPAGAFRTLLDRERVDLKELPDDIVNNGLFKQELARLTRAYELIEAEEGTFLSYSAAGVTPAECRDFCDSVYKNAAPSTPFNVYSLVRNGFSHELTERGCSAFLLDRVLVNDVGGRFSRSSIEGNPFFSKGTRNLSFPDVARYILSESPGMDSIGLSRVLHEQFSASVPPMRIASRLWLAGMLSSARTTEPIRI